MEQGKQTHNSYTMEKMDLICVLQLLECGEGVFILLKEVVTTTLYSKAIHS